MSHLNITVVGDRALLGGYDAYIPSDPVQSAVEIERFRYILIAMYSVFAWEHLVTLHEEIARWKQLLVFQKVVPVNIMVLAGRYLVWANVAISGTYFFGTPSPDSCQALFSAIFTTYALIYFNSAFVFVLRLRALYQDSKRIRVSCYVALSIVGALWVTSLAGFYSQPLPEPLRRAHLPICIPAPSPKWRVMGFAASACMDLFILVLTVAKTRKAAKELHGSSSSPHRFITETAIVAAAITFVINTANTISDATQNNVIVQAYAVPIAVAVLPITTFRVVFHSEMLGFKSSLLQMSGERGADGPVPVHHRHGSVQLKGMRSRQGSLSNSAEMTGLPFTNFDMSVDSSPKINHGTKISWSNSPALGRESSRRGSTTTGSSVVQEQEQVEETVNAEEGRAAPRFTFNNPNPFGRPDVVLITRETITREE